MQLDGRTEHRGHLFSRRAIGAVFPPSYRKFLSELGSCEADGTEFLGIHRTPAMGDALLGTVHETSEAREDSRFPRELLLIQYDGMGGLVSLDAPRADEAGETPVVLREPITLSWESPEVRASTAAAARPLPVGGSGW